MITDCSLQEQHPSSLNFLEGRRQVTLPKTKRAVATLTFTEDRSPFHAISLWTDWQLDGLAGSLSHKAGFSSIGSQGLFGAGAYKGEMALSADWHKFRSQFWYLLPSWVTLRQLLNRSEPHLSIQE